MNVILQSNGITLQRLATAGAASRSRAITHLAGAAVLIAIASASAPLRSGKVYTKRHINASGMRPTWCAETPRHPLDRKSAKIRGFLATNSFKPKGSHHGQQDRHRSLPQGHRAAAWRHRREARRGPAQEPGARLAHAQQEKPRQASAPGLSRRAQRPDLYPPTAPSGAVLLWSAEG